MSGIPGGIPNPSDAFAVAMKLHHGQVRKFSGEPYIDHPRRVAESVARSPELADLDPAERDAIICAAFLHDAVEDTDYTIDEAREYYGDRVGDLLYRLTHEEGETYYAYIRLIRNDTGARIIKRADLADNLSSLPFDCVTLWARYVEALRILAP